MILFFIDESGNTGARLDHEVEKVHWMIAIAVDESCVRPLDRSLYETSCRCFGLTEASTADFELKGSDLFGGRGFAAALSPESRIACYEHVVKAIGEHDAQILVRGINKPLHARRASERGYTPQHPYQLGFQYLIEQIDEWLEHLAKGGSPQLGLVVADQQQEVDRRMVHQFEHWTRYGTSTGYRSRSIDRLIHTLHYVRSTDSRLVQLADCVAFLRNRVHKVGFAPARQSDQAIVQLWQRWCVPHIVSDRVWP